MPAVSQAQQSLMAMAEHDPDEVSDKNKGVLKMSHSQLHDFASTKRSALPHHKKAKKFGPRKKQMPHYPGPGIGGKQLSSTGGY
jgi:hypothetical protein